MKTLGWLKGMVAIATVAALAPGCASSDSSGTSASRGGDSPAVTAAGRADGGVDKTPAGNGASRTTLMFPTGDKATSLIALEATGPEQVRLGQPYNYNLRVTNLTDTPLHDVRVDAAAPIAGSGTPATRPANGLVGRPAGDARLAAARTGPGADRDEGVANPRSATTVWNVGTLAPKQSLTYQVAATADEIGLQGSCMTVHYQPSLCVAVRVVKPELAVTKEGPSAALICQDLTYTYRVTNTGTGALQAVRLDDALPEGLTTAEGQRAFAADIGTLREGETKAVTGKFKATRTGQFASRATASAGDVRAASRVVPTTVRQPALAVSVEGPEAHYVGQAINYRVTVRNTSDVPAENTVVALSAIGGSERLSDRTVGTIPPGESRSFAVNIGSGRAAGNASLTASATATCAAPAQDSASVAVLTIPALRLECVDNVDPVAVGQTTTYTINVKNQGSGADNTIALKATLPPEFTFVRGGGASAVTADGQNLTFAPVATLAPAAEVNWTVEVKAARPGDARFYVEMTSASLTRPVAETESTRVSSGDAQKDIREGAPVVPQGGPGPAPAAERPQGQQNNK
jgi:uncharacterized repeat protein (TIGR01451 family)